jgi:hypothetical protein
LTIPDISCDMALNTLQQHNFYFSGLTDYNTLIGGTTV